MKKLKVSKEMYYQDQWESHGYLVTTVPFAYLIWSKDRKNVIQTVKTLEQAELLTKELSLIEKLQGRDKMKNQITCKKCGSSNVKSQKAAGTLLGTGGCLVFIPVIGWILAPIFAVMWLLSLCTGEEQIICNDCKKTQHVSKKKYKQSSLY